MAQQRITRDDLESKFREAQGGLQGKLNDKKQTLVAVAATGGFVLLLSLIHISEPTRPY